MMVFFWSNVIQDNKITLAGAFEILLNDVFMWLMVEAGNLSLWNNCLTSVRCVCMYEYTHMYISVCLLYVCVLRYLCTCI